jgi:hypothetical protein
MDAVMWRSLDTLLFVQRGCMPSFVCKVDFAQMLCNGFPFWQKVTTLFNGENCSLLAIRFASVCFALIFSPRC